MQPPTVLIYGSPAHPGLSLINDSLLERSNCRPLFVIQEEFFSSCQLFMDTEPDQGMLYLTEVDAVSFPEITSVCLDGFYVSAHHLEGFPPDDVAYIQTEAWSTLIAMFAQLGQRSLMANFFTGRDHMASRWARLCCLATHGLTTPRALVTSDPGELESFYHELGGELLYKPVADPSNVFANVDSDHLERFDRLTLAPTHFEEPSHGEFSTLCLVGLQAVQLPLGCKEAPRELVESCQRLAEKLGLTLAEFSLCNSVKGEWRVTDIHPFVSPAALSIPEVLGSVCLLLETGRQ